MPAPGILALDAGPFIDRENTAARVKELEEALPQSVTDHFPVIVLVDDAPFIAQTFNHFLWVTFTRSNPSHDIYGLHALTAFKHWGCRGPVVIDARIKPWHAPVLETDPTAEALADRHFRRGAPLAKWG